mgnify:CR=1 FL=1
MNYGNIKECDIADGPGVRVSLLFPAAATIVKAVLIQKPGIFNMAFLLQRKHRIRSWSC